MSRPFGSNQTASAADLAQDQKAAAQTFPTIQTTLVTPSYRHPLANLDGKRKYIFSGEFEKGKKEDFYLRICTSMNEMLKCPEAILHLGRLGPLSVIEKRKEVPPGKKLTGFPETWASLGEADEILKNQAEIIRDRFNLPAMNQTVFVVENSKGEFAAVMVFKINDPDRRTHQKVVPQIGTFISVSELVTGDKYRGKSLLSPAFDKVMTMLSNPKRHLPMPMQLSVSMTAVEYLDEQDQSKFNSMMNLDRYKAMWGKRFDNLKIQNRRIDPADDKQKSPDKAQDISTITTKDGALDPNLIHEKLKEERALAAKEGSKVRGLYLQGDMRSREEMQKLREDFLAAKKKIGMLREKTDDKKGWKGAPNPSSKAVTAAAVVDNSHIKSKL